MITKSRRPWRRHLPLNVNPDTQATGKAPTDMPGMADNTQGQPGTATSVAKQGLPDTVGNVNHDVPNVETAMTINEIRYSGAGGGIF